MVENNNGAVIAKVFLDDLSHLTTEQQKEINSILRSEYNRFQRKAYQKENTKAPMVASKGIPIAEYTHKFFSRYYNKVNQMSFQLEIADFEVGKSYQIIKNIEGFVSSYGDSSGEVMFYTKNGSVYAYINTTKIPTVVLCTVVLSE